MLRPVCLFWRALGYTYALSNTLPAHLSAVSYTCSMIICLTLVSAAVDFSRPLHATHNTHTFIQIYIFYLLSSRTHWGSCDVSFHYIKEQVCGYFIFWSEQNQSISIRVSRALYSLSHCAIELHCCPDTIKSTSVLHWLTYFSLMINMGTVVYFKSIPHTPTCCCQYWREHKMCTDPQLQIDPDKCTICSCVSKICYKTTVHSWFSCKKKSSMYSRRLDTRRLATPSQTDPSAGLLFYQQFYCAKLSPDTPAMDLLWSRAKQGPPNIQVGCGKVLWLQPTHNKHPPPRINTHLMSVQETWEKDIF